MPVNWSDIIKEEVKRVAAIDLERTRLREEEACQAEDKDEARQAEDEDEAEVIDDK